MIARINAPKSTYSVKDVYDAAIREMKKEVAEMSKKPLTAEEERKLEVLARSISNEVLKDMKVV